MTTIKTRQRAPLVCLLVAMVVVCVWAQKKITVPKDFSTIQRALGEAVDGDTVYVRNGIYYENITLSDDVVLIGQDRKGTIIDGRRKGPTVTAADGAVITGFTIRNGTTGILCKNTRPVITNNIVIDNKGTGIHALVSLPDIVNNVVYRNAWTGIFLESVRGTRTSIDHNVIMENGYSGIFGAGRTEVLVRNNILYGNKQYGVFLGPDSRKTRIVGNNIYANRFPYNDNADNQTVRQQNISADPQFVAAGFPLHKYEVSSKSPCKGKGEEGADIGLSEALSNAPVSSSSVAGREKASELDQFFGAPAAEPEPSYNSSYSQPTYSQPTQDYGSSYGASQSAPADITGTTVLYGVNFGNESADLSSESYAALDAVYASLNYYKNLKIEIAGHTDNQGNGDFNKSISYRRAKAVMDYFVSKGIPKNRMVARGYGGERPVASNETYDGRAANMRIEVIPQR